jgi:hypothetical protein
MAIAQPKMTYIHKCHANLLLYHSTTALVQPTETIPVLYLPYVILPVDEMMVVATGLTTFSIGAITGD